MTDPPTDVDDRTDLADRGDLCARCGRDARPVPRSPPGAAGRADGRRQWSSRPGRSPTFRRRSSWSAPPTKQAALDIARNDIYLANGVWVEVRARPFGLVVRSGARRILTASTSAGSRRTTTWANPSRESGGIRPVEARAQPREVVADDRLRRRPAAGAPRSGRGPSRPAGRARSPWPGRRPRPRGRAAPARARARRWSRRRRSASRPRGAAPARGGADRTPRASRVWSASSPETIARNRSDDRTSSAAKWRAANVDLPTPGRADQHDQARVRTMSISVTT